MKIKAILFYRILSTLDKGEWGEQTRQKNLAILFKYKSRLIILENDSMTYHKLHVELKLIAVLPTNIYIDKKITDMIPTE